MAHTMRLALADLATIFNLSSGVGPGRANTFEDTSVVQRLIDWRTSLFSGGAPVARNDLIDSTGFSAKRRRG